MQESSSESSPNYSSQELVLGGAIALLALGWLFDNPWLIIPGMLIAFFASWSVVRVALKSLYPLLQAQQWKAGLAWLGWIFAIFNKYWVGVQGLHPLEQGLHPPRKLRQAQ